MKKIILITGSNGDIGRALCDGFKKFGWVVIGTDIDKDPKANLHYYLQLNLSELVYDSSVCSRFVSDVKKIVSSDGLTSLINNAAVQIVNRFEELEKNDWIYTINVNLIAPIILIKNLLCELERANGSVLNISSIHSKLTKPNFSAYSTSKAAFEGLTKSLSVEIGSRVRVNAIRPAAIDTKMLREGFANNLEKLEKLQYLHPSGKIGESHDIFNIAYMICDTSNKFLNGSIIGLDGGISSCLKDPQ